MKNKGFTLIELLAVIVVLAIVLIIAIPNVLEGFNKARLKAFEDDILTLQSTAKSQFRLDKADPTLNIGRSATYCSKKDIAGYEEKCANSITLKLNVDTLDYVVDINTNGEITSMYVTNYRYDFNCTEPDLCKEVKVNKLYEE